MPQKRNLIFLPILALLLLLGIAGSLWMLRPTGAGQVEILQDGTPIFQLDLAHESNRTFEVEYNGSINRIEIKDHQIRILDADCPDQTCVHMGWLQANNLPIVCLPHHLVIQYTQASGDVDTMT